MKSAKTCYKGMTIKKKISTLWPCMQTVHDAGSLSLSTYSGRSKNIYANAREGSTAKGSEGMRDELPLVSLRKEIGTFWRPIFQRESSGD